VAGDNLDVLRSRPDQCVVEPGSHCFVVVIDVVCSGEGGWVYDYADPCLEYSAARPWLLTRTGRTQWRERYT